MPGILPQPGVTGIGQPLDLVRQATITIPESRRRAVVHRSVQRLAGVSQGLVRQCIQPALGDVSLELPVPGRGIELGEPGAEHGQVVFRELADGILDLWIVLMKSGYRCGSGQWLRV